MITMTITKMINLLNGTTVIKSEGLRKHKLKKSQYLLLGIHQDIGIGVCQKMKKKKKRWKNYGHKHRPFCIW